MQHVPRHREAGDAMNCTATTRLTAEQCMERLAACPALPRGERLATFAEANHGRLFGERTWHIKLVLGETVAQEVALGLGNRACFCVHPRWFRDWAAPVRRLREERRALREALAEVLGGECEKVGRWCLTHTTTNCYVQTARMLLMTPAERARYLDHIAEMEGHPKDDGGSVP